MSVFEISGILVTLAAVLAYLNIKLLRLPTTIGLMLLALIGSVAVLLIGRVEPEWVEPAIRLVRSIDFDNTLMQVMLGFLLFAGALHVKLGDLRQQVWVVAALATAGVVATTGLVGLGVWGLTRLLGLDLPLIYCFIFGSLIAPTDPIAVLAVMKQVGAPKSIETKLAGESLFNDGVGVVVFLALLSVAGLESGHGGETPTPTAQHAGVAVADHGVDAAEHPKVDTATDNHPVGSDSGHEEDLDVDWGEVAMLFAEEAGGGVLLGLGLGVIAYLLLRWLEDYKTEVLISLAIVAGGYPLATHLHWSGPLAMVVAGLLVGNPARHRAMSDLTAEHLDTFWELIDDILNAVLFVLIGLEVLVLSLNGSYLLAGGLAVPLVLLCRFVAVGGAVSVARNFRSFSPHAVKVVTWAGLRGGISVALALILKDRAAGHGDAARSAAELVLTMTYVVVAFSILVQGLTIAPMLRAFGLAGRAESDVNH